MYLIEKEWQVKKKLTKKLIVRKIREIISVFSILERVLHRSWAIGFTQRIFDVW